MKTLTILSIYLTVVSSRAPVVVKFGALFHEGDKSYENIFDKAISDLNLEYDGAYNFMGVRKSNVARLPVDTIDATCDLLRQAPSVIFGPWDPKLRFHTANIAQKYNLPHVFYSFMMEDHGSLLEPSSVRFNAYPSSGSLGALISQAEKMMSWQTYAYIYQTNEALSRITQTLPKHSEPQKISAFRELIPYRDIEKLPEEKAEEVYESLVKGLQKSGHSTLLIDVEPVNLRKLLLIMKKMDLMNDYFMALLTSLDLSLLEMGDINTRYTVANITYFRFIKDPANFRTVEEAVLYDAVVAYGNAIDALSKHLGTRQLNIALNKGPALSCHMNGHFDAGQNIAEIFRRRTSFGRYTGYMRFDVTGERDFEADLVTAQGGKTNDIAVWRNGSLILNKIGENQLNDTLAETAKSKIFRVVTRIGGPYVLPVVDGSDRGRLIGDRRFEGYCIDLITRIEEFLGIRCEFYLVPDGNYGSRIPNTKKWNGIVKELLELKADFGICDLTITSERQSAVDFTAPFMNLGISILLSKSAKEQPPLFAFMSPFSPNVWLAIILSCLLVFLVQFVLGRLQPDEWFNPHPCKEPPENLENNFTPQNSFWTTIGSLMQQGSDILPKAFSIRMLLSAWYCMTLVIVASYTANLTAFLTATKMEDSINDVNDLARQTKVSYGSVMGASTYSFFKNSNTSLYQRIFNTMDDAKPSVFVASNEEGVDRVIKGKKRYAFFMESTGIEYQVERHCELTQVGNLLDNKGYGIALPRNSPYRTMVSTAILYLQEKGELQSLKNKWWKEIGGGKCDRTGEKPVNTNELGMAHLRGAFLVLGCGCLLAVLMAIFEFVFNISKVAIERRIPPWQAMKDELKFYFNFGLKTKPVLGVSR